MRWNALLSLAMAGLVGAGCLGSSPAARFYTLSTLDPHEGQGGGGGAAPLRIRVAPVTLPEGVDRPQIVRRTGENTVVVEEYDRWVEPLGDAVPGLSTDRTVVVVMNRLYMSC